MEKKKVSRLTLEKKTISSLTNPQINIEMRGDTKPDSEGCPIFDTVVLSVCLQCDSLVPACTAVGYTCNLTYDIINICHTRPSCANGYTCDGQHTCDNNFTCGNNITCRADQTCPGNGASCPPYGTCLLHTCDNNWDDTCPDSCYGSCIETCHYSCDTCGNIDTCVDTKCGQFTCYNTEC